jgi:hypothetical protein
MHVHFLHDTYASHFSTCLIETFCSHLIIKPGVTYPGGQMPLGCCGLLSEFCELASSPSIPPECTEEASSASFDFSMEGNERIGVPGNPGGVVAKAALQGVVSEGKDGVEEV